MVISPPFLPVRHPNETETQWVDRAMEQQKALADGVDTQEGSFPISGRFMWHTGLHLSAPYVNGQHLPVRAVADGTVIYIRQATRYTEDPDHALNYSPSNDGPKWTDDGCVIIRHSTEIGAKGDVVTSFTYFTLTMHLCEVDPEITLGKCVCRKDVIGRPGKIYAAPADIHFEVCCDEAQLINLIGKKPEWQPPYDIGSPNTPTADGRADAVFGDLYIYLPVGTATAPSSPKNHLRSGSHTSQTLGSAQWVRIRYELGQAYLTSLDLSGKTIGSVKKADDFEYQLYEHACAIHKQVTSQTFVGLSSPSGWYDLLRFGRKLGPDPLPVDAAHWREIPTATGTIWADLNSSGTFKLSEADFPSVGEWNFFSDDTAHHDQRCQSANMKRWIANSKLKQEERFQYEELANRLGVEDVKTRLRRAICFFPTEWDRSTIEARHSWLRHPTSADRPISEKKWAEVKRHAEAISAGNLPEEYKSAKWRFHPQEFLVTMRRVGWLSKTEFLQTIPGHPNYDLKKQLGVAVMKGAENAVSMHSADIRMAPYHLPLGRVMRKYSIDSIVRMVHFLAQVIHETAVWSPNRNAMRQRLEEWYFGRPQEANRMVEIYAAFYGRGIMQLTWAGNFADYGEYRSRYSLPDHVGPYIDKLVPNNPRITETSTHWTGHPNSKGSSKIRWFPRFDPDLIVSDAYNACDSGGFYWVSKHHAGRTNINRKCDEGLGITTVDRVSVLVNGGGNGRLERQVYAAYLSGLFDDVPRIGDEVEISIAKDKLILLNLSRPKL